MDILRTQFAHYRVGHANEKRSKRHQVEEIKNLPQEMFHQREFHVHLLVGFTQEKESDS